MKIRTRLKIPAEHPGRKNKPDCASIGFTAQDAITTNCFFDRLADEERCVHRWETEGGRVQNCRPTEKKLTLRQI